MQRVLEVSAALSLAGGIAAIFIAARRSNPSYRLDRQHPWRQPANATK
jgi:hypothetical protein